MTSPPRISLDSNAQGPFPLGSTIKGRLTGVQLAGSAVVELRWRAVGKQTKTDVTRALGRCELTFDTSGPEPAFEFLIPCDVPSHHGNEVSIRWNIDATVDTTEGKATTSEVVEVVPAPIDDPRLHEVGGPYRDFARHDTDDPTVTQRIDDAVERGGLSQVAPRAYLAGLEGRVKSKRLADSITTVVVWAVALVVLAPVALSFGAAI